MRKCATTFLLEQEYIKMGVLRRFTLPGLLFVFMSYAGINVNEVSLVTGDNYSPLAQSEIANFGRQLHQEKIISPSTEPHGDGGIIVKNILIFGDFPEMLHWPELSVFVDLLQRDGPSGKAHGKIFCPDHNVQLEVTVSDNTTDIIEKDAVIFGLLAKSLKGRLTELLSTRRPSSDQLWVYYSTETPLMVRKWTETDNNSSQHKLSDMMYNIMMTYHSESEVHIPFGRYTPKPNMKQLQGIPKKSNLIYWMASNCDEVSWPRSAFVRELEQYLPLHTYGKCGRKQCLPVRSKRCFDMLDNYKFYLAIANGECREYITEKLWTNTLSYNTVPVVYGAKKEDFARLAPPNSFIHISDFKDTKALADYLLELDRNDTKYRAYFEWKNTYEVTTLFPVRPATLCHILPYMNDDRTANSRELKHIRDTNWYQGCRKNDETHKHLVNYMSQNEQNISFKSWMPW